MTIITYCTCRHKFQDSEHGKNLRLHNIRERESGSARCTVCGTVRTISTRVGK